MNPAELRKRQDEDSYLSIVSAPTRRRVFALSLRERRIVVAGADFLIGALACYIAFVALRHPHLHDLRLSDPFVLGGIWVIALLIADGYAFQIPSSRGDSAVAVIKALPLASLLTVLFFFLHPYVLTRSVMVSAVALGCLLLIAYRVTAARWLLHESLATRVILVADHPPGPEVVDALGAARFEYRVVETLVRSAMDSRFGGDLVRQVGNLLVRTDAEEVVVTSNELRLAPGLVQECLTNGVRLVSAGDLVERYMRYVPIDSVDVHWYLGLPDSDVWRRPYAAAKRLSDLLLASLIGIPFLVLLPLLAVLIKLDSPGVVILSQRRVGEGGREFDLYKLRTMATDAEAYGARYAATGDPRITRVGRILRAIRLDEFPQLLNIVRGEMSFIGPRPERPEFITELEARIPHFSSRRLVKPGLTGWAQINGGYASTLPETVRKLEYDLYYIKNRSLHLDLQILFSTFGTVAARRGR